MNDTGELMKGRPTTFWAKLERDDDGNVVKWHPLIAHCADVAAVFEALLQRTILSERLATLLGWEDLDSSEISRLSVLAALHDAGKVNLGFQAREDRSPDRFAGHVTEMIAVIDAEREHNERILGALGVAPMLEWFDLENGERPIIDAFSATWAHHGCPVDPDKVTFDERLWEREGDRDPISGLRKLAGAVENWFPDAFQSTARPFPDSPAFRHAYNGVLNLADWLGSNDEFFPYATSPDDRMEFARRRAGQLVADMHLDARKCRAIIADEPIEFGDFAPFDTPHDIQQACLDLPVETPGSLTVLESDTGSGKTEAALARFVRLFRAGAVDGMYFAVPTRAAAKQLHNRVRQAMERLFGEDSLPTVLAVPGYIRVDELDGDPNALPGFDVQWPDEPNIDARAWAAEDSRRYLAAPVAVGTVDQVLMSALQIRHSHLRAAALLRQFLVVDEIHSSDPYMHHTLQNVLDHHLESGGHAMLMSATLSTSDRIAYTEDRRTAPPSIEEAVEEPYPLLTYTDASRSTAESTHASSSDYRKDVELALRPDAGAPERIAERALEYAQQGARVLVIRNVVKDCVATQRAVENLASDDTDVFGPGGVASPHHSRFGPQDRRLLDNEIEATFGKHSKAQSVVAVATQTVEQSLDIDADILITDLCPADVLLQRIGRLQRHDARSRPAGFETARVDVLVPESRQLGEAIVKGGDMSGSGLGGEHGLGTVYADLRILEATWRQIESDARWVIPDDNRRLVERTTHPGRLQQLAEELGDDWLLHHQYVEGVRLGKSSHSELVTVDRSEDFTNAGALDDIEQIKTRLGNDNWSVEFEEPQPGPFGKSVSSLTIPEHWLQGLTLDDEDELTPQNLEYDGEQLAFQICGRPFAYDRLGLRRMDTE